MAARATDRGPGGPFDMKPGSLVLPFASLVAAGVLAVIEPATSADAEQTSGAGCWIHLYELPQFSGDKLSIEGPADVSAVERAAGPEWSGPRSLELGPDAHLEASNAAGTAKLTLAAGQDIPDFRNAEPPNLLGPMREMRLACDR